MGQELGSAEYDSLQRALSAWEPMKNQPAVCSEVEEIVGKLRAALGEAIRVHIPEGGSYVAVTFASEPKRVGAYVRPGLVDHIIELGGSYIPEASPNYWRSDLSTARAEMTKKKEFYPEVFLCPDHHMSVPKYGGCPICGWSPLDA